ncbi:MAG TPA: hypothetical protein VJ461_03935 [Candidatus Nanoarchaeia archaeon]|nr:hypothetical protein [Candidatus Nanoarchaeia archaeon]
MAKQNISKKGKKVASILVPLCIVLFIIFIYIFIFSANTTHVDVPERCNMGPEFHCEEWFINRSDGIVLLKFRSNLEQTISNVTITNARRDKENLNPPGIGTGSPPGDGNCFVSYHVNAKTGEPVTYLNWMNTSDWVQVECDFTNSGKKAFPRVGERMIVNMELTYVVEGESWARPLSVEIYSAVIP